MSTTLTEKTFAELFAYAGGTGGTAVNAQGWIQPTATPRFDFDPVTKAAKGLLIEGQRSNLLLYSSRFENPVWNKASVTVVPGAARAPNGRWDACKLLLNSGATAGNASVVQTLTKTAAALTYAYSFYAKAAGSSNGWIFARGAAAADVVSIPFSLATLTAGGSVGGTSAFVLVSKSVTDVGNDWRRVEIVFTSDASTSLIVHIFPGSAAGSGPGDGEAGLYIWGAQLEIGPFSTSHIPSAETFTGRASIGSYYDADGVMRYAAAGAARNSREPSSLTLAPVLLLEEQRTNILQKSSDMHLAPWTWSGAVRTQGRLAPDGTLRAVEISGASTSPFTQNQIATATVMTYSIYVKNVSRTAPITLLLRNTTTATNFVGGACTLADANPSIAGAGWEMRPVGNGWFRCTYTQASGITVGDQLTVYAGILGAGADSGAFQVWGAQLEAGAFASSYIPSTETFTSRASIGTYFDSTGAMKTAAAGFARMTYNPADLTIAPWLLLEGQSTNLLLNSQIAVGTAGGTTPPVVASATIDGEACVAATFTSASTVGYSGSRVQGGPGVGANVTAGTAYSTSAYVKLSRPLTGSESINVYYTGSSGMGGFTINAANSPRYVDRFSRTVTPNITPAVSGSIYPVVHPISALTSDLTVWVCKGQIEEGAVATSYIPTTTAQVTRVADTSTSAATTRSADASTSAAVTRSGDAVRVDAGKGWCNPAEGTISMEFRVGKMGDTTTRNLLEFGNQSIPNRVGLGYQATGGVYAYSNVDGVSGASTGSRLPVGPNAKVAMSFGVDGLRFVCDNSALLKVALPKVPTITHLGLGCLSSGSNQPCFHIRDVKYFPQKLGDAEVVALTM